MPERQLAVIGAGNMGEALLRGVLSGEVLPREALLAIEAAAERRLFIGAELGVAVSEHLSEAAGVPAYVLAVKPQQMDAVLPELRPLLPVGGALVISIVAGLSTRHLAATLGPAARVVRAMPNTPMLVGCGCTGLCRGPGATDGDFAFARRLFAARGEVVEVDEAAMDAVTAVSGSGPAYFFYLIEAMVRAGVAEGLSEATALALARQTCAGAARLLIETGSAPQDLRRKVTSPGGTTQAAIQTMEAAGVGEALVRAVRAAAGRSRELGR